MLLFSSHEQGFMQGHMMASQGESPVKQRRESLIDGSGFFCARCKKNGFPKEAVATREAGRGLPKA
jgi:hypothetical protein